MELMGYPVTDPDGRGGPDNLLVVACIVIVVSLLYIVTELVNGGLIK